MGPFTAEVDKVVCAEKMVEHRVGVSVSALLCTGPVERAGRRHGREQCWVEGG